MHTLQCDALRSRTLSSGSEILCESHDTCKIEDHEKMLFRERDFSLKLCESKATKMANVLSQGKVGCPCFSRVVNGYVLVVCKESPMLTLTRHRLA